MKFTSKFRINKKGAANGVSYVKRNGAKFEKTYMGGWKLTRRGEKIGRKEETKSSIDRANEFYPLK
jgi:hypothetical protein